MDMLSFTTIILLLLITIGIYLSITNRVEGKTRIVIIIAVLICLIWEEQAWKLTCNFKNMFIIERIYIPGWSV